MKTAAVEPLSLPDLSLDGYRIPGAEKVLTPALVIYTEIVESNIDATLGLLGGDAGRWRPHVKTAKLGSVMRRMVERGVKCFKCSTTLELMTVCEAGASDVLLAYPAVGANAGRVRRIAEEYSPARVSALVETPEQVEPWRGSSVGLFIDINPGMDRTGVEQDRGDEIIRLAEAIESAGLAFRGVHYYDGHLSGYNLSDRQAVAHRGYDRLMEITLSLERTGLPVEEVITAGTPAFPCSISYEGFSGASFTHRASPGTVIYSDCTSLSQLPAGWGYRPAAVVLSTVVSRPAAGRITCDAGHKTVSADAGVPTCAVLGHPGFVPLRPSEEHLPIDVSRGGDSPSMGESLYLVPRHVCPTVNNFDHAVIAAGGRISGVERVTARGREAPLSINRG
jgi:D-serine deaminase-like pyridoxal phosphate-dependent protein